jgi:hypothetical protein
MKFSLEGPLRDNIFNFMRKAGYFSLGGSRETELNYIRTVAGDPYPRFHLYLKNEEGTWVFNLHLDQKKPSYEGSSAHSGEYDGETVEKEAERIKEIL